MLASGISSAVVWPTVWPVPEIDVPRIQSQMARIIVDRIADGGVDKSAELPPYRLGWLNRRLDGLDQFRRLLSILQPTE